MNVHCSASRTISRRLAFTLVEMLVVLVLMGLIAATIAPNLAGTTQRTHLDQLIAKLIDLDAQARVTASAHKACYFEYDDLQEQIVLRVIDEQAVDIQTIDIPGFVTVELEELSEQSTPVVIFNRLGHTSDYNYTIINEEETVRLSVNGLTGWHEIVREVIP